MKIFRLFAAAGLVIASLGAPAIAQDHGPGYDHQDRGDRDGRGGDDRRDGDDRGYRGDDRGRGYDRGDGHHDNGHHYGWRNGGGHGRCYTQWRHHRQVRVCR